MRLTIVDLEDIFNQAIDQDSDFIGIVYYIKNRRRYELEVVNKKDFKKKLGNIKSTYTKELVNRKDANVEIAKACHASNFDAIKRSMFEVL